MGERPLSVGGRRPSVCNKTTREMWEIEPPSQMAQLGYRSTFSEEEFEQIRCGLMPSRGMEDKWFLFEEDHTVFFHRSWTGRCFYMVSFERTDAGWAATDSAVSVERHFRRGWDEEMIDFIIRNLLLGESNPFPLPGGRRSGARGVLQQKMTGTGFPERPAPLPSALLFWLRKPPKKRASSDAPPE